MGDHALLDNLDLFDQSRFGASEAKINLLDDRHGDKINYAGFGLDFDQEVDQEGIGAAK